MKRFRIPFRKCKWKRLNLVILWFVVFLINFQPWKLALFTVGMRNDFKPDVGIWNRLSNSDEHLTIDSYALQTLCLWKLTFPYLVISRATYKTFLLYIRSCLISTMIYKWKATLDNQSLILAYTYQSDTIRVKTLSYCLYMSYSYIALPTTYFKNSDTLHSIMFDNLVVANYGINYYTYLFGCSHITKYLRNTCMS